MMDAVLAPGKPYFATQQFQRCSPAVRDICGAIVLPARHFDPANRDPKKTDYIRSDRACKREQVSADRRHLEVKLTSTDERGEELTRRLGKACEIAT